jgi:hypothetical protein
VVARRPNKNKHGGNEMINTQRIMRDIDEIERRYNGDNDIISGAPVVQWPDMKLAQITKQLIFIVNDLQKQLDRIYAAGYSADKTEESK